MATAIEDPKDVKPTEEKPVEEKPKLTEKQMAHQRDVFLARAFQTPEPPEPEPEPETEEAKVAREKAEADAKAKAEAEADAKADEKQAKADKAKADEAKKKKKAAAVELPKPVLEPDPDELAERIAEKAAKRVEAKLAEKPEPAKPTLNLSEDAEYELEIIKEMAKSNPANKGLDEKFTKFWTDEAKRKDKWEHDHPGEVYDPAADEHNDWYAKNQPTYSPLEYRKAENRLAVREVARTEIDQRIKPLTEEQENWKQSQRMAADAQEIASHTHSACEALIQMAAPELVKSIAGDGEFKLDETTAGKILEEDPMAAQVIAEANDKLGLCVAEIEKMTRYGAKYPPVNSWKVKLRTTGETFYPHQHLEDFAVDLEQTIAAEPKEDTMRDGKLFMTQAAMAARAERIQESGEPATRKKALLADLSTRYYTMDAAMVKRALVADLAQKAKQRLELAGSRQKKNGTPASQSGNAEDGKKEGVVKERTKPPGALSSSPSVDKGQAIPRTEEETLALADKHLF